MGKKRNRVCKICQHCGIAFEVYPYRKDTANYCCRYCSDLVRRGTKKESSKVEIGCSHCGKRVLRWPYTIREKNYCSRKCMGKDRKERYFVKCDYCDKELEKIKSKLGSKYNYCNENCQKNHRKEDEKAHPNYKGRVKIICGWCNEEFFVEQWEANKRKYCSEMCYGLSHSGENSHCWKGGISQNLYCGVWTDDDYKQSIKMRDGNKCLNPYCFGNSKRLALHHINYDKGDCSFKNLITICIGCNSSANRNRNWHKKWYQTILHRRYGYVY